MDLREKIELIKAEHKDHLPPKEVLELIRLEVEISKASSISWIADSLFRIAEKVEAGQ